MSNIVPTDSATVNIIECLPGQGSPAGLHESAEARSVTSKDLLILKLQKDVLKDSIGCDEH